MYEGEHIPFEGTPQQRQNLRDLADYANTGVTEYQFDMMDYWLETECGTVACLAGHGPFVLGLENPRKKGGIFNHFVEEHFTGERTFAKAWCFSMLWVNVDNTPRGGAARIYYMLEHGVPGNYQEQIHGLEPLCYTVEPLPKITESKGVEVPSPRARQFQT